MHTMQQQDNYTADCSITMEPREMETLDDTKIDRAEEIEKMEDDTANMKPSHDPFTAEEEKRLIRKLDFWYDSILSNDLHCFTWPVSHISLQDCPPHDGNIYAAKLRQGCHECCDTVQFQCRFEAYHYCRL